MESCRLWMNLASPGHRGDREPATFLHFKRTGLLIGLPDEPGVLIRDDRPGRLVMEETDAAGLGLRPDDLADGVAICRDAGAAAAGWRCEPDGGVGNPGYWSAYHAFEAHLAAARVAVPPLLPPPTFPVGTRVLLFVSDVIRQGAALEQIAELARVSRARVTIAMVGELPETPEHAAEEREALARQLAMAAEPFRGTLVGAAVELGGDPVHGLLSLLEELRVDVIVLPEIAGDREQRELADALRARTAVEVRRMSAWRKQEVGSRK